MPDAKCWLVTVCAAGTRLHLSGGCVCSARGSMGAASLSKPVAPPHPGRPPPRFFLYLTFTGSLKHLSPRGKGRQGGEAGMSEPSVEGGWLGQGRPLASFHQSRSIRWCRAIFKGCSLRLHCGVLTRMNESEGGLVWPRGLAGSALRSWGHLPRKQSPSSPVDLRSPWPGFASKPRVRPPTRECTGS